MAANIEDAIEKELVDRLKNGVYGEIYNYNPKVIIYIDHLIWKVFEKIMKEN